MDDLPFAYGTAAVIVGYFFAQVVSRRFDPFAPIWLFLVGYVQVYVIQAISYHAWAVSVEGPRPGRGGRLAGVLGARLVPRRLPPVPRAWPRRRRWPVRLGPGRPPWWPWSPRRWPCGDCYCSGVVIRTQPDEVTSAEMVLFRSFPFVMMVAAILLIVTGRNIHAHRPAFTVAGLVLAFGYVMIWMFNGKRSHSLIARAGHRLRLLHHAPAAALMARAVLDRLRRRPRGGDRHHLEERPRPRALGRRLRRPSSPTSGSLASSRAWTRPTARRSC